MPERDNKAKTDITITEKSLKEVPKAHSKYDERPYGIEDNRHMFYKKDAEGDTKPFSLCNFLALIKKEIIKDDGLEESLFYEIEVAISNGSNVNRTIEVPVKHYKSMEWVEELGARFLVNAGSSSQDKLREAIKYESIKRGVKTKKVFTHTGWREINGKMYFLAANGALGDKEIGVEIKKEELAKYCLLEAKGDPVEAIRESLQSFFLAPRAVTIPLWTAMYLAPLTEFSSQISAFALYLTGESGTMKSSLYAIFLSHYGDFIDKTMLPADWDGTANGLEEMMFYGKDIPYVIDDAAPPADKYEKQAREQKAERIIRAQGNRSGRIRMNMARRFPRGLLLTNGEMLTSGYSRNARMLYLYIKQGEANTLFMNKANKTLYCSAMSHYITWVKDNWDRLKKSVPARFMQLRNDLFTGDQLGKDVHNRIPEIIAGLFTGFEIAMTFCLEKKAITQKQMDEYRTEAWNVFIDLGKQQAILVEEYKSGRKFLDRIKTMYAMGGVQFLNRDSKIKPIATSSSPYIGWYDIDESDQQTIYYIEMSAAIKAIRDFDSTFTWDEDSIKKSLASMGKIHDNNKNHLTKQVRVGVPIVDGISVPRTVCVKGFD